MAFPDTSITSIPGVPSPSRGLGGLWVLGDVDAVIARTRDDGAVQDGTAPAGEPFTVDRPAGHGAAAARWSLLDEHLDD